MLECSLVRVRDMTYSGGSLEPELFKANPAAFLENAIREYVARSSSNRLQAFHGDPIFDEPLVSFANGDDAIFQDYKAIIGDFHLTPREALEKHLRCEVSREQERPPCVSVISWILPVTYQTRLSLRKESVVPSLRWNHTRWHGQDFINELARNVVSLLESLGHQALAPELADFYELVNLSDGLTSNWSQRHIAYAAGLGTFSLSDGFITPRGIAIRCGSVVCDVALSPTPPGIWQSSGQLPLLQRQVMSALHRALSSRCYQRTRTQQEKMRRISA